MNAITMIIVGIAMLVNLKFGMEYAAWVFIIAGVLFLIVGTVHDRYPTIFTTR